MAWLGVAVFISGIIFSSIGGYLSLKHNYKAHNEAALAVFQGKRIVKSALNEHRAVFSNPKTRWWHIIGTGMLLIGMLLIVNFLPF